MVDVTFDDTNLLVLLPAGQTTVDVQAEMYSAWKEHRLASVNNRRAPIAFTTEGGTETIPGEVSGRNFFFRNDLGWRIKPAEQDGEVVLVGNLFKADVLLPLVTPTSGGFTVLVTIQRSSLSLVEQTGISGLTVQESAALASTAADAGLVRKIVAGRRAVVSPDNRTITFYDDDNTTVILVMDISADGKLRERTI